MLRDQSGKCSSKDLFFFYTAPTLKRRERKREEGEDLPEICLAPNGDGEEDADEKAREEGRREREGATAAEKAAAMATCS